MKSIDKTNSRAFGRRAFTLAELLIVVAIIAVLVGVSIPIFTAQKEKSAEAVDIANMRAAKAAAIELYYAGIDPATAASYGFTYATEGNYWAVYDPDKGSFFSCASLGKGSRFKDLKLTIDDASGQGTSMDGGTVSNGYNSTYDYSNAVLFVTIYPNGAGGESQINIFKSGPYKGMGNVPCIIIEWRRVTGNNSYVGRDKGKWTGEVIFIN